MKDGRTHLAHKAEHAVDMETGAIVAVTLHPTIKAIRRRLDDSGNRGRGGRAYYHRGNR
jgi:transposase